MRWKRKPQKEWEPFFAIFPIEINGEYVWLEWLERKTTVEDYGHDLVFTHEYRIP